MKFIRYGGLSPVDYKSLLKKERHFHTPPLRFGIYAFIFPYEESFLWAWKVPGDAEDQKSFKEHRYRLRRVFNYDGPVWSHFQSVLPGPTRGSWVYSESSDVEKALGKIKHQDIKYIQKELPTKDIPKDPYIRSLGGIFTRDHLEVFIDSRFTSRIR